jgi:hypothetical protein
MKNDPAPITLRDAGITCFPTWPVYYPSIRMPAAGHFFSGQPVAVAVAPYLTLETRSVTFLTAVPLDVKSLIRTPYALFRKKCRNAHTDSPTPSDSVEGHDRHDILDFLSD